MRVEYLPDNQQLYEYMEPHYDPKGYFIDALVHTWMVNRNIVKELDPICKDYIDGDIIWSSCMFMKGDIGLFSIPLVIYNIHPETVTTTKHDKTKWKEAPFPTVYPKEYIDAMDKHKIVNIRPWYLENNNIINRFKYQ